MDAKTLLERLFPDGREIHFDGIYFSGTGRCAGTDVAVIGTVDNTPIGIELAYRMAGAVLDVVRNHPGRPILLLVDTQGQRLSHRDELLGINGYIAHLPKCLVLARGQEHRVVGVVFSEVVGGGFLVRSMLAEPWSALREAEIPVLNLP